MINFRYHIVSLMAVFLALAVGIAVGVSLSPSVSQGLADQAAQDRKQVTELRTELDRRNALDEYRDAWAARAGQQLTAGALTGVGVALVLMPGAPTAVAGDLQDAVEAAGGTVVRRVEVADDALDADQADVLDAALADYAEALGTTPDSPAGLRLGRAVSWSVAATTPSERDAPAIALGAALQDAGLVTLDDTSTRRAELVVVVTAPTATTAPAPELTQAHVQFDLGLRYRAGGVVVAGPNSAGIDGTDVLAVRTDNEAAGQLSTVDVADLTSGVATVVLAGQEQLLGRQGHYGALSRADTPLPTLPVR